MTRLRSAERVVHHEKSLPFRFRSLLAVLLCGAMLLLPVGCSSLSDVVAAPSAQDAAPEADVIGCAGFSASDYEQRVREVLGSAFWSGWDTSGEYFETETAVEFFNEQFHKTLSPENVDACVPYINENGQLCIIAKLYALAAADYYWHDLNTVDFEYLTYYADDAQLGNGASDMIADVFPEETDSASPAYTVVPLTAEMLSGTWAVDADFTAAYNDMSLNDLYGSSFTGESRMTFAADGSFDYAVAWCFGRGSYTLQDGKLLVTLTEGDPETLAALYAVSDGTVRIAMDQYGDGIPVFWVRK